MFPLNVMAQIVKMQISRNDDEMFMILPKLKYTSPCRLLPCPRVPPTSGLVRSVWSRTPPRLAVLPQCSLVHRNFLTACMAADFIPAVNFKIIS